MPPAAGKKKAPKKKVSEKPVVFDMEEIPSLFKARLEIAAAKGMLQKLQSIGVLEVQQPFVREALRYIRAADINIEGASGPLERFVTQMSQGGRR